MTITNKLIAIGDIHGRDTWKKIVKRADEVDKVVFIGDYFDSREGISVDDQLDNFKAICSFLRQQPKGKVKLLIGNHDYHYLRGVNETYSGYQAARAIDIQEALEHELSLGHMGVCNLWDGVLFSHAGITKTWLQNQTDVIGLSGTWTDEINELFRYKRARFRFTPGENYDNYGDDITQGPLWVRPDSLQKDGIPGVMQVVGHTAVENVRFVELSGGFAYIDALAHGQYLLLEYEEVGENRSKITISIQDLT